MTPDEWRDKLLKCLAGRQAQITTHYAYYRGDHPLPWAPTEVRDAYRAFLRMSRTNFCRKVVKAPSGRLRVVGLRFSDQDQGDVEAWKRYWQANRLDAESRMVHDAALIARRGFALVWPNPTEGAPPTITPEHPSQVIVEYVPGNRRARRAGLKSFVDPDAKQAFCTLWLPGEVHNWTAPTGSGGTTKQWEPWTDDGQGIAPAADSPFDDVPLVEFVADPDMIDEPMSELDGGVLDIQDRINKMILDRLVTSNFSSFKQRWATGLEIPTDENDQPVEPFKTAVDRLWMAEDPNVNFGEFSASDLAPYLSSVEADVQHLAAVTDTPLHDLLGPSAQPPSAESLKAAETPLIAKVGERQDSFTESWEDVIRLALRADNDGRADDMAMAMMWKNPEARTTAEMTDAAVKMLAVGIPKREVWAFLGYSPTDIDRMDAESAQEMADMAALGIPPVPTGPTPGRMAAPAA